MDRRIYNPAPRDLQIRRLRRTLGLTQHQAEPVARLHVGECAA